jgi:hypothetical protein
MTMIPPKIKKLPKLRKVQLQESYNRQGTDGAPASKKNVG